MAAFEEKEGRSLPVWIYHYDIYQQVIFKHHKL